MASLEITPRVVEALTALYSPEATGSKKEITRWLESFQKKPEAWAVADYLLTKKDSDFQTRLFAAQTLKIKITYDLQNLNLQARLQLRDSLVELVSEPNAPKALIVQLCLALADLAIQILDWKTVVGDMVDKLGQTPEKVECLLEFLKVLPEEMQSNTRIPLSEDEYKMRAKEIIDNNAERVLSLLSAYMQSSGDNSGLQQNIFMCLHVWIYTGSLDIRSVVASPLYQLSVQALESQELFDVAVEIITEIIRNTSEEDCYADIVQQIYPLFATMLVKLRLAISENDDDVVKGYCSIFVEAGVSYVVLMAKHPDAFNMLLEGISECAAYSEVDIVEMTFGFWYELTKVLETHTYRSALPSFVAYYDALTDILIKHLQYPSDDTEMTLQSRDEFSDFRHHMGDTLKDCCRILTPQRCLLKPLNTLTQLLSSPTSTWQQIEAPIFSLRSMGAEVPKDENEVMPVIMDMLSKLPDHPKIRYAATLVISRYSFWTKYHPQYITYQLNFISSGFGNAEVAAASALALKHLCKDCSMELVEFVPQLQMFYANVGNTLSYRDKSEVTEAICHVIAVLPVASIKDALQSFCLPVAQKLHAMASKGKDGVSPSQYVEIGDTAEQISTFFKLIRPKIPLEQSHPCVEFIVEIMPVLDLTMANFGDVVTVCEPTCACFVEMISSYGPHLLPFSASIMERMVNGFEATSNAAYVWVASQFVSAFVNDQKMFSLCWELITKMSELLFTKMQGPLGKQLTFAICDYYELITIVTEQAPHMLIHDLAFLSSVFRAALEGLKVDDTYCLVVIYRFYCCALKTVVGREQILNIIRGIGEELVVHTVQRSVKSYIAQVVDEAVEFLKAISQALPNESLQWMASAMNQISEDYSGLDKKNELLNAWALAINEHQWGRLTRHFSRFLATCKRSDKS
ncbi:armadillo-type protein [Sporodiniella umbellata]|nr:armadillo-type protein [Sporodiniella umbellata]